MLFSLYISSSLTTTTIIMEFDLGPAGFVGVQSNNFCRLIALMLSMTLMWYF